MPSSAEETGPNGTVSLALVHSICIQAASFSVCGETSVLVVGKESLIIHDYMQPVSVYSYDKGDGCKEYHTASAAVAYDHPQTGQIYMLVIISRTICCVPCSVDSMVFTLVSFPSS